MKKRKQWKLMCLLYIMIVISLSGCGIDASNDDFYVIGGIGPITGETTAYGLSVKQGAELAVKEINDSGGVTVGDKKMQLQLKFRDDEADIEEAKFAYHTLMDNSMDALLGCVTSDSTVAVAELSNADRILQITPTASVGNVTKKDNVFRMCFTNEFQGEAMADYIVKRKGYKQVATFYKESSEYSMEINASFQKRVEELGGTIVAAESFMDGENFEQQLSKIKESGAEAIFVPVYYGDAYHIVSQADKRKLQIPFFGTDGWDGILDVADDKNMLEGTTFLTQYFPGAVESKTFVTDYEKQYSETPNQFAADGYDSVYVIKAALEQAKTIEKEAVIKAMTKIEVDGLTGKNIHFVENGESEREVQYIQIKNGIYNKVK